VEFSSLSWVSPRTTGTLGVPPKKSTLISFS